MFKVGGWGSVHESSLELLILKVGDRNGHALCFGGVSVVEAINLLNDLGDYIGVQVI